MRSLRSLLAAVAAAILVLPVFASRAHATFEIMVPAYFYPAPGTQGATDWATMASAASAGYQITAILNPEAGPGAAQDGLYLNAAYGVRCGVCSQVLGFTYTRYGERPIEQVMADIDKYYRFYPVSGIFLDEMVSEYMLRPDSVGKTYVDPLGATVTIKPASFYLDYYARLYTYIQGKTATTPFVKPNGTPVATGTRVVGNVGINAAEISLTGGFGYGKMADDVIVLENTAKFLTDGSYTPSAWNFNSGYTDDIGYLIHTTPTLTDALGALATIAKNNGGIAYVTDGPVGPDTFGHLSPYWSSLIAACTFCPPTTVPEPSSALLALIGMGALAVRRRRSA